MNVTILREHELRKSVIVNNEAVDAVALGFTRLVEGKVSLPPIIRVDVEANQGEVDIKTASSRSDHSSLYPTLSTCTNLESGTNNGGMSMLYAPETIRHLPTVFSKISFPSSLN